MKFVNFAKEVSETSYTCRKTRNFWTFKNPTQLTLEVSHGQVLQAPQLQLHQRRRCCPGCLGWGFLSCMTRCMTGVCVDSSPKTPLGITSDRQAWHLVFNNFIICPLAPTQNHQSWFFRKNYESKVVATTTFWVTYQLTKLNSGFEGDLFPTEHQSSRDSSVWGTARQDRILHQLVKKHFGNSCDSMWFDDINSFDNVSVISYNPLACNQKIWTLSCCRILRSFKRILCPAFIHTQMPICAEG